MNVTYPDYLRTLVSTFRFVTRTNTVTPLVNLTSYQTKWPEAATLGLNDSQYLAFKSALTQEMSVIQGLIYLFQLCRILFSIWETCCVNRFLSRELDILLFLTRSYRVKPYMYSRHILSHFT